MFIQRFLGNIFLKVIQTVIVSNETVLMYMYTNNNGVISCRYDFLTTDVYQPIFQMNYLKTKMEQPLYLYVPKHTIREFEKKLKITPNFNLFLEKSTKSINFASLRIDLDCFVQIPKYLLEFKKGLCSINSIIGNPIVNVISMMFMADIYSVFIKEIFTFIKD